MAIDPRTPVIVGAGQLLRHPTESDDVALLDEPVEMMAEAVRLAAAGQDRLLTGAEAVLTVDLLSWRYANAPRLLARRLGASPRWLARSAAGGNSPQLLVNHVAAAIQRGELDVAVIAGAEAIHTRLLARKTATHLPWTTEPEGSATPEVIGTDRAGLSDAEMARSLLLPVQVYPVFENALRAASAATADAHLQRISSLWARFSDVAAANPYAWSPLARTAAEIGTVSAANRMIGFPYPKLLNANIQTDQAAALIVTSVAGAIQAGVPEADWVYVLAGADAHDHWFVSNRWSLAESPAIGLAGRAALGQASTDIDQVAHIDLYSCFPAAVEMGASALGLSVDDRDRPLTVTGGLGFAGGPGNDYATHSIATMVEHLRRDPGSLGLITALGWYATKHAVGVYSTRPPAAGFRRAGSEVQDAVDALPSRPSVADHEGPVTIESFTVMYERDNVPAVGIVACLLADGRRTWANTRRPELMAALTENDLIGGPAMIGPGGDLALD